jgi:acetoin:2,6-dichlorophenolindophenol oxidoreductase subunit alpha
MYRKMLRIRRVQERIESLYLKDHMKTPIHLCIGQEAIAVGFCHALHGGDYVSSNHRSHGHYLAKGGDLKALIAELHGRETGCSKGFGGSMHVIDTSVGHLGSSSIVGGGIPLGTGMALASKMQGSEKISVVFFGDGAADEGVLYESINFAMLKKLPVVYVLENNKWSVCSPVSSRQVGKNVFHKGASPENLLTAIIDGNDLEVVYETALKAINRARCGEGPSFIECDTYRILGHAGCKSQDPGAYRNAREVEEWRRKCPIALQKKRLHEEGILSGNQENKMEEEIKTELDEAFAFAMESPLPAADDLNRHIFCE